MSKDRRTVELLQAGLALGVWRTHFKLTDDEVKHLVKDVLGLDLLRLMASKGGSVTSEAKAVAVRENGKKGGRPRKKAD